MLTSVQPPQPSPLIQSDYHTIGLETVLKFAENYKLLPFRKHLETDRYARRFLHNYFCGDAAAIEYYLKIYDEVKLK